MEAEGDGTAQQGLCGRWAWQITGYLRLLILSTDQFASAYSRTSTSARTSERALPGWRAPGTAAEYSMREIHVDAGGCIGISELLK